MRQPRAFAGPCDAHRTDGATERNTRDAQRGGRAVDGEHVVGIDLVGAEHRAHDMDLVAEPVGERRAQRPVDETAVEDRGLGGPALTTEERTGDLACGVHALFDIDGQRKEIGIFSYVLGRSGRDEHDGVAEPGEHCAIGLTGELAGLETHDLARRVGKPAGNRMDSRHRNSLFEMPSHLG